MNNTGKLAGQVLFITGASRGIGKAIAIKAARDGAKIVLAAKTAQPHDKLPGTIYSAAEEVEKAGGQALPCVVDVRDDVSVQSAVNSAVAKFGCIDIVVNNASAISLTSTLNTEMKRFDLMHSVNARATYMVSKFCLPHLMKANNAHILTLSPPLSMLSQWFSPHLAYSMSKYGMSMCVLGMSEEFAAHRVAVNALWPRTAVDTAAMRMLAPGEERRCRRDTIVADAAYAILCKPSAEYTGNFVTDEHILRQEGITDFKQYLVDAEMDESELFPDLFVEDFLQKKVINDKKSNSSSELCVSGIFEKMKPLINKELVDKISAKYQFEISGVNEIWHVDLSSGDGSCGFGEIDSPDSVIKLSDSVFLKLFSGELDSASAFLTGKMKISGNMSKSMQLDKLVRKLRKSL